MDNEPEPITVELYIRSNATRHGEDNSLYKIERIWHSDSNEEMRIEEKSVSRADYESFVESLGISFSNAYYILQQGKVNQVTLMD